MEAIILEAIKLLNDVIDPVGSVNLIDSEMVRKYPDYYAKLGYLGVTILVTCGKKKYRTFLKYQYVEDMFFGTMSAKIMADNFIWQIIDRDDFFNSAKEILRKHLLHTRREKIIKINETISN